MTDAAGDKSLSKSCAFIVAPPTLVTAFRARAPRDSYVFARRGTHRSQQTHLTASNAMTPDNRGQPVSLSADGTPLAARATGEDSIATGVGGDQTDNSASVSGAVYLYQMFNRHMACRCGRHRVD